MSDNAAGIKAMLMRVMRLCNDGTEHQWTWSINGSTGWKSCSKCGVEREIA